MTYLALPVNARNGSVAEDVTRTFLKAQLRDENSPLRLSGFLAFDIEGFSRPGPDLPYEKVAVQEVVRDQRRLHTYMVHVSLFTSQEAN